MNLSGWRLFVGFSLPFYRWLWLLITSRPKQRFYLLKSLGDGLTIPWKQLCATEQYQGEKHKYTHMHSHTLPHTHLQRNSNRALFMKGNVCMGRALKCRGSRMTHLILPERKERESNEKGGCSGEGGWVWWCSSGSKRERRRLVSEECKSNKMMEGRGMEERKPHSQGN